MHRYPAKILRNLFLGDSPELKALAAGTDGRGHLVRFGCRKYEDDMPGRFFEGLEKRIERLPRQHVHLVYNVDFISAGYGGELYILPQFANLVYPPVRGAVNFADIDGAAVRNFETMHALIARDWRRAVFTVQRLRQNPGNRGFSHPARPAEEECVGYTPLQYRVLESTDNMLLSCNIFKYLGTALSCQNAVFLHKCSCEKKEKKG
jgi:hypothetical protein